MLTHDCVDVVCYQGHVYCQECSPNCPTCNKVYVPRDFQGVKELERSQLYKQFPTKKRKVREIKSEWS